MAISGDDNEPFFLLRMYQLLTDSLQNEETLFSENDFMKEYLEIQDLSIEKVARMIFAKMLEEKPLYQPLVRNVLTESLKLHQAPDKLLVFAESLKRQGAPEEDVLFFQKYAFQFSLISAWKQNKKSSCRDRLEKSLDAFETLRCYRTELSQRLQIESSDIVRLIKKVLPKHIPSCEVEPRAKELQERIQNFFNANLFQVNQEQTFSIEGSRIQINARIQNLEADLLCYESSPGEVIGSHLCYPSDGKIPTMHMCKILKSKVDPNSQISQRNVLCTIPQIEQWIVPAPSVLRQGTNFLLKSSFDWGVLKNQIEEDPFAFSGRERIEIMQQILQSVQKLAEYQYKHRFLDPTSIQVRKTENGIEARLGSSECIVAKHQTRLHELPHSTYEEMLACAVQVLLGVDTCYQDWQLSLFQQVQHQISPEQFQHLLFLKRVCDRSGELYYSHVHNYVQRLLKDEEDVFSIAAIEQFAEKMTILRCMEPILQNDTSKSLEDISIFLNRAKKILEDHSTRKERTEILHVPKEHLARFVPFIETQEELDLIHEILSSTLQHHDHVGSDLRFHKGDLWNGQQIPFSFRFRIEKRKAVFTVFPPISQDKSYGGSKLAYEMQFMTHGNTAMIPIEVVRDSEYLLAQIRRDIVNRARSILKIPGTSRYFAFLPSQRLSYEGAKKVKKWEMYSERYQENLAGLTIEEQMGVLYHLLQGVKLIAREGVAYGEIHQHNVGVYRTWDGDVKARFLWKTDPSVPSPLHYDRSQIKLGHPTPQSDIYAFVCLVAETLLMDLQRIPWTILSLEEIKAILKNQRLNREEDLRIRIEEQIEDFILPLLKQVENANFEKGQFPDLGDIEQVLLSCFEILEEPFPYLHPVLSVEPKSAEPGEHEHES